MPFTPPSWVPKLPPIPDNISLERFMFDERYGRYPLAKSRNPFTCGLTGRTYTFAQVKARVDHLSRALTRELGFKADEGTEWDKVVAVFSLNTIDYITLAWAVHRIGGILTCVNAAYNASELDFQLKDSGAKAIFTCLPLLETAQAGAKKAGLPGDKVFLLQMAQSATQGIKDPGLKTLDDFVQEGSRLPFAEPADAKWKAGDGGKKIAFLCYSSGTSGLPKGVMISHRNVIANTMQFSAHGEPDRESMRKEKGLADYTENALGLLPMSHIYGLVVVAHTGTYRGDGVVVLPRYDFALLLKTIEKYKLAMLYLVPPMIIHLTKMPEECAKFDLSSVRAAFTGAAPLGEETAMDLVKQFPNIALIQGYGMTETSTVVSATMPHDIWFGSSGSVLADIKVRIVDPESGKEITEYGKPGELWVNSPAVVPGYLNRPEANKEMFVTGPDGLRYARTGDEAVVKKSKAGFEHIFITDRIKELIKVKGHQVAPAELEAHVLTHEAVNDCVVIGIPSEREGEVPKAFVVKRPGLKGNDEDIIQSIQKYVADHKSDAKRLRGGVEFIEVVPKSPSGKILRRLIRDQEKEKMRKQGAKL